MRTIFLKLIAVALVSVGLTSQAAAKNLRMLLGWDSSYPGVEMVEFYAEAVKEASGGDITVRKTGPEAVPPFEQLQPVAAGVFDLLYTHPAYHMGTTALGLGLQATYGNPLKWRDNGAWEAVDQHYRKHGLKLLALPVMGEYMIITKQPVTADGDLKGLRIRAAPIYGPLIKSLGASATILPPAEIYSALERSVVDGAAWPVFGPLQYKWYEVTDYMVKPTFGQNTHQIFMNLNRWNGLSEKQQKILLDAGLALEKYSYKYFADRAAAELDALREAGLEETHVGPEQRKMVGSYWSDGVWGFAIDSAGADAKALYELLKQEGMAK